MYTITIKKVTEKVKVKSPSWTTLDKRPYTQEELKETSDPDHFSMELKEVRGYTPEIEETVTVETEIYKQTIDNLDLVSVIKAVNQ